MTATALATETAVPAPRAVAPLAVISGAQVQRTLQGRERQIVELVEATYRLHSAGQSVNPPSYFLRFPDRPSARIIALPASIGGDVRVDGLKWISSFPGNSSAGIPRASAVLILNDHDTGYPFACLEASIISATRTAALAASAADWLSRGRQRPARIGFVGVGLIARYVHTFLAATGWSFDEIGVHDLSADSAAGFCGYLEASATAGQVTVHDRAEDADPLQRPGGLRHRRRSTARQRPGVVRSQPGGAARVAARPSARDRARLDQHRRRRRALPEGRHLAAPGRATHRQPRLRARHPRRRDRRAGARCRRTKPVVFSPFGLGVLDLAVGKYVYDEVDRSGELRVVDDFFHELRRYGSSPSSAEQR